MSSLVPNVGKAIISGRMFGGTPTQTEPHFVGWGTGATAGSALGNAIGFGALTGGEPEQANRCLYPGFSSTDRDGHPLSALI